MKNNKTKSPKFRIMKRTGNNKLTLIFFYLAAIVFALGIGALLLSFLGVEPFGFYTKMLTIGTINSSFAHRQFEGFVKVFVPLLITSLALSLSFKMKFWNIGGEGQFIVGSVCSAWIALSFDGKTTPFILFILMIIGGAISAGIYGLITAVLKVKFGTNETLMTLMFNYIALYFLEFFEQNKAKWNIFLDSESARPKFVTLGESAWIKEIPIGKFDLNISLIISVIITVIVAIYLSKSKHGYEIQVVGDSLGTAKFAGMNVNKIIMRTVFVSAALIGVAASMNVSTTHVLSSSITNNVGWTGIIVAWLSKLNPIAIFITSILITVLQYGCSVASSSFTVIDSNFANLLQGIILFIVLVSDFFIRFKIVRTKSAENIGKELNK